MRARNAPSRTPPVAAQVAQYKATAEAAVAKGKEMGAALAEIGGR